MRFLVAGTEALLVETADLEQALALFEQVKAEALPGVREIVPAARTVLLRFDPTLTDINRLQASLETMNLEQRPPRDGTTFDVPVIYDGEDLPDIASILGCSVDELIRRHTQAIHTVAFTGFAPGFAYMTSSDPSLDVPRRRSPRVRIPAGSVALAGKFCGVYPTESPGGWQLMGRTPTLMWDLTRPRPALLVPGDRVRFYQITEAPTAPVVAPVSHDEQNHAANICLTVIGTDRPLLMQDEGRPGNAAQGISSSGALDRAGYHAANDMLGNRRNAPALELVFGGASLRAEAPVTLALTGAPCRVEIADGDGRVTQPQPGRAFALDAGDTLTIGMPASGIISYLGIRGGFAASMIIGSSARDTLAGIGPEPIITGARLYAANSPVAAVDPDPLPGAQLPRSGDCVVIDIVIGPRADWFTDAGLAALTMQDWQVTPEVSRVGKRLLGTAPIERRNATELASEPTVAGAIQVPHSGQPVIFLADHPVTGGYPVIGVVARYHLDLMAQVPPGALIRFRPINKDR